MSLKRITFIGTMIITIMLLIAACGIIQPADVPSQDLVNTSVAATVNAQPQAPTITESAEETVNTPTEVPLPVDIPNPSPLSIAFVAPDDNAYAWLETYSSPVQLTTTGDVREAIISKDGTRVVLVRSVDWVTYSLDIINSDGTNMRTLVNAAGFDALPRPAESVSSAPQHISWVADTTVLAMTTRITYEGPGSSTGETLFLIDSDTSSMRALLSIESLWSWDYTYSPDFTKIAISTPEGMHIYKADGSLLVEKAQEYPFINTASEYAWLASPKWSADSSSLVAAVPPQDPWATPLNNASVWRVFVDGRSSELLFNAPMSYRPMEVASVSPDLSRILFLVPTELEGDNDYILRMSNIDGTGMEDISTGEIYNLPSWATDSSKFYYYDDGNGGFVGQPGSSPISIPDFDQVRSVHWIDGYLFVGTAGSEGGWKLLIGSVESDAILVYSTTNTEGQIRFTVNR